MIVFRLAKTDYSNDLSGKGAEIAGGRWNSKGVAMVYTSDSRALCTAEIAVHIPLGIVPNNYCLCYIELPDKLPIYILEYDDLPPDWKSYPHSNTTQMIGDSFVKARKYAVMRVPSVVVQGDFNYVINPFHNDAKQIKIIKKEPFPFDERLFIH